MKFFHHKPEIHLLLPVNKCQVKNVSSYLALTHQSFSPSMPGRISLLKAPSPPSDFSGAVIYQQPIHIMLNTGSLEPLISFGL